MTDADPVPTPGASGWTIVVFGAFYPMTDRAGGATSGMAVLIARHPQVRRVVVVGPVGSRRPEGVEAARLEVDPVWAPDRPLSLVRALRAMSRRGNRTDAYVFSIYPTAFGRTPWTNVLGLLLPVIVRRLTGRPVVVFMHNFVETQNLSALGYRPSAAALRAVRWLERRVVRNTVTAVGLASMRDRVESALRVRVHWVPLPFVESVLGDRGDPPQPSAVRTAGAPLRILLFGTWGPQKDLEGALETLEALRRSGRPFRVTVAGAFNPNFPEYAEHLKRYEASLSPDTYRFPGRIPDAEVPELFRSHDVLFLPYRATGGYSGVLNLGASWGIPIVAYPDPQLKEFAAHLSADVRFVPPRDAGALGSTFEELTRSPSPRDDDDASRRRAASQGVASLLRLTGLPVAEGPD